MMLYLHTGQILTGRDGNDGMGDLVAEVSLSSLLHLAEDHGGNFLRGLSPRIRIRILWIRWHNLRILSLRPCI